MSANFVWLLVEHEGAVLLALRRDDGGAFAGRWTLPGGEIEAPESAGDAARRLASKQLATEVMGLAPFSTLSVDDAGVARTVDVLRIGYEGRPRYRPSGPFAEVGWADPAELDDLDIELPPELRSLLERLAK
ncbi:MAG TPA: NUDIX domain-containing protein [Dehalococcoidia bacterium]